MIQENSVSLLTHKSLYLEDLSLVCRRVACLEQLQKLLSCVAHRNVGDVKTH